MKKDKQLVGLLANVVRKVVVEDIYLDRALRDLFRDKKVTNPHYRKVLSLYAPFILRLWFHFGGGKGESIVNMVVKALEIPANEIAQYSRSIACPDFPEWFIDLAKHEIPDKWLQELIALSGKPDRYIRTNSLRSSAARLLEQLARHDIQAKAVGSGDAIMLLGGKEIFGTPAFKDGLLEIQDISSQEVAPFLMKSYKGHGLVVDACAGNGGKSLHLGSIMRNRGRILSMDIYPQKLEELKRRALKNGITNIETRHISTTKVIKRMADKVDYLLLDVPCSGTGVFRRNPESKLRITPENIEMVKEQQADIVNRYSKMVKPGGEMVYATCSILTSENRGQVDKFLANNPQFSLQEDRTILPSSGGDGFYMARLKRI